MDGIQAIMQTLRRQREAIEEALLALERGFMEGERKDPPGFSADAAPKPVPVKATRKGGMTPAGRKRLAEAMKRRWAVKRAGSATKKRAAKPKKAA